MLKFIIQKEIFTASRDIRIQLSAGILLLLMITAVLVGKAGQKQLQRDRESAQSAMYDQWVNQGNKHPHSAAHYGQFAFKPKPVLSFLDTGLDNYTGISVFLEAHKQNEVLFSGIQDGNAMSRFGEMTGALVFQVLLPLLIIFLTFNTISKEREEGTLKLVHGQGLASHKLLFGKVLGTFSIVLAIFLPIVILGYLVLDQQSSGFDTQVGTKFMIMVGSYALFFLIFIMLSVLVSAFSKNSRFSLLTLLGIWIVSCIILPKATTNFADKLYPTPSQFEFRNTIAEKVQNGIDGHNPSDERLAKLRQQVLQEYGVSNVDQLPVNWSGIAMQAGEEYTDQVYDQEFSKVEKIFQIQNRVSEWAGFINPYLAIHHLSMALAGTDFEHHVAFVKAAENYRREFVKKMNKDMEINHKPGVAFNEYQVGKEMWTSVAPFQYKLPMVSDILSYQWRSVAALCFWFLMLSILMFNFSQKVSKLYI